MATVRDYVRANIGETHDKLTDTANFDGGNERPDVVGLKIEAAMSRFNVTEDDLDAFARSYIGDYVTRTLIPIAIDYSMVKTRLVDNASRPAGVTPLGGEVGQNYNRINALQALDKQIANRLIADRPEFYEHLPAGSGALPFGMVNGNTDGFHTMDPYDAFDPPQDETAYVATKFVTPYVVNPG